MFEDSLKEKKYEPVGNLRNVASCTKIGTELNKSRTLDDNVSTRIHPR